MKRIGIFIENANSLIEDEKAREEGGFKLSEPDFKFEVVPEMALLTPMFSPSELKVSSHAASFLSVLLIAPRVL